MEYNFSDRVRDIISSSREEAIRLGHDYIGTEHLLLGLLNVRESRAVALLQHLGCDVDTLRTGIEDTVAHTGGASNVRNIPLTREAEQVLKDTYREAKQLKSSTIYTEHLLLSLLRLKEGVAAQALQHTGLTYEAVLDALNTLDDLPDEPATPLTPSLRMRPQGYRSRRERLAQAASFQGEIEPSGTKVAVDLHSLAGSPLHGGIHDLTLQESDGNRRISIAIGLFEAQAIALEREGIRPPRPMTHDLFKNLAEGFDITLNELCIDRFKSGTFFCTLLLKNGDREVKLDARPSDAVALAVRTDIPMFVDEAILAGVGLTDEDN